MQILTELTGLRGALGQWRSGGQSIAFVPTMGNLHAGHFSLIARARQLADRVVASVFVNPTQFGPNEDFSRYPRTPEQDAEGLANAGCDALWLPGVETMYPFGADRAVSMHVPGITDVLDGAARPGHFDGVTTVVSRLFLQVQPDVAIFGRKDYQQLAVIRYFVRDLAFPIEIIGADIKRDDDGLALSSRNQYLTVEERAIAPLLYRTLQTMRDRLLAGEPQARVEAAATSELEAAGFRPDYTVIRTPGLEAPVDGQPGPRVALLAARLGTTRLIDNLEFDLS
ncbi:MAG: pantoate--beta-alanine ligase [Proteobacteria bacterium]|nr:pantoate--beta-alanine ligase [Pseudomonadota bacterium]